MDKKAARELVYQDNCYTTEQYARLFNEEVDRKGYPPVKKLVRVVKRFIIGTETWTWVSRTFL